MKTSILIIAHNEEKIIANCLDSVCHQSIQPDEILLIAHNCTDRTVSIASKYPSVKVVAYDGPIGITHARIKGFEMVTGDIVACIDGDSVAEYKWFECVTLPLKEHSNVVGVGTNVLFIGNMWYSLLSYKCILIDQTIDIFRKKSANRHFVGSSFAVRKKDYESIGTLAGLVPLKEDLKMEAWMDDVYLPVLLLQKGRLEFVRAILVKTFAKEKTLAGLLFRLRENKRSATRLLEHLHSF